MRNQNTSDQITKNDLERIEASLKKVIKATQKSNLGQQYIDLLNQVVDTVHDLRVTVEFDHEQRLQAIEEYLQQM